MCKYLLSLMMLSVGAVVFGADNRNGDGDDTGLLAKLESLSLKEGAGAAKVMTSVKPSIVNEYRDKFYYIVRDRQDHSKFAYQLYDGNNDGLAIVPYHNPEMPHIVFRAAVIKHSGDDEWFFNIKPEIKTVSNLRYSYLEAKTPGVHMYSDFYTAVRCLWTTAAIFGDVLLAKQELAQKH